MVSGACNGRLYATHGARGSPLFALSNRCKACNLTLACALSHSSVQLLASKCVHILDLNCGRLGATNARAFGLHRAQWAAFGVRQPRAATSCLPAASDTVDVYSAAAPVSSARGFDSETMTTPSSAAVTNTTTPANSTLTATPSSSTADHASGSAPASTVSTNTAPFTGGTAGTSPTRNTTPVATRSNHAAAQQHSQEARLAAGLVWCAQQLAGSCKEVGDTEEQALAYLQGHGVRCTAHYTNNVRHFGFPGCSRAMPKDALVPAIEEQKRAGTFGQPSVKEHWKCKQRSEALAEGLMWCAKQLATSHDGAGSNKEQALVFLHARGVECIANNSRAAPRFRFPGCDRALSKDKLAAALGLQRKPGACKAQDPKKKEANLAAGLIRCAKHLASSYDGVGDTEEQALAFLHSHGVTCVANASSKVCSFCLPGSSKPMSRGRLVAALGLQKKPAALQREALKQQLRQRGLRWLAERYWNVYQVGDLEPGKASVEDVEAELHKMGVRCASAGCYNVLPNLEVQVRSFCVPGMIQRCNATALAKALRLKLLPGCTGASRRYSSLGQTQIQGMLRLANGLLKVPRYREAFGGTSDPQHVCNVLMSKGVWCSPWCRTSGYVGWRVMIKGRPGKQYNRASLMEELYPGINSDGS